MMPATENVRRLAPQSGAAFIVRRGDVLQLIDVEGEQVADLTAFALEDTAEWLSSGRTIDYGNTIYLTIGHTLYSNRSRPMWTILDDTVGRHDFLLAPCSPEMFARLYHVAGHHPSCYENLARHLAAFGIRSDAIPTTFNVFMNVDVTPTGSIVIRPPRSRAGDSLTLRAEMDLVVGVTSCSAELTNNGRLKPIDVVLRSAEPATHDPAPRHNAHAAPSSK